jgi:DnaK suppressor protein
METRAGKRGRHSRGSFTAKTFKGKKVRSPLPCSARARSGGAMGNARAATTAALRARPLPARFPPADEDAGHVGRLPLGPDELDTLRGLLEARRKAGLWLAEGIKAAEAGLEEAEKQSVELVERATDRTMESSLIRQEEMERLELDEIEAALRRFRTGSYGICESCGKRIPRARLLARPEARRCLRCKYGPPG